MADGRYWIEKLGLTRHREGGYYRETYRSGEIVRKECLPGRFGGGRALSTAIYFLLEGHDFSAFHRLRQDEVWHFYEGSPLTIHVIDDAGGYGTVTLGRNAEGGEVHQAVVKAGRLFGATVTDTGSYSLVGCTMAPGFDFTDFEMPVRSELIERYPKHRDIIDRLTR